MFTTHDSRFLPDDCLLFAHALSENGTTRLSTTKDELTGQEQLFKESKKSLKELKQQSSGDRYGGAAKCKGARHACMHDHEP